MHNTTLIYFILIIIILIIFKSTNIIEHLDNISTEAISNITSIYNKNYMIITNLKVTEEITAAKVNTNDININNILQTKIANIVDLLQTKDAKVDNNLQAKTVTITDKLTVNNTLETKDANINNNLNVAKDLTAKKISVETVGNDNKVYWGNFNSNQWCDGAAGDGTVGDMTHEQLYNNRGRCDNMCPPGMYMIGIRQGKQWSDKHPLCKKFQ